MTNINIKAPDMVKAKVLRKEKIEHLGYFTDATIFNIYFTSQNISIHRVLRQS